MVHLTLLVISYGVNLTSGLTAVICSIRGRFIRQEVRHIELRRLELVGSSAERATLSEVQAYGEGYVSDVIMTSPLIKLDRAQIFSTVEWDADVLSGDASRGACSFRR